MRLQMACERVVLLRNALEAAEHGSQPGPLLPVVVAQMLQEAIAKRNELKAEVTSGPSESRAPENRRS